MDDWEADGAGEKPLAVVVDKWAGEDEDEDLPDNWDDSSEDENTKEELKPVKVEPPKKGGKRYLQQKLKEKEEQRKKELERRMAEEAAKTPEDLMSDRLRAQKLAEESDLEVAKSMFGVTDPDPDSVTLDNFQPRTKDDFTQFAKMLQDKFTALESSPHYSYLIQTLTSTAVVSLTPEDLKKISSSVSAIATEKLKIDKAKKGGKKSHKAKLGGGFKAQKNDAMEDLSQFDDEYGDFM